jgi:hypothetical protein
VSARVRPPHDPTHPEGGARSLVTGKAAPQRVLPPSAAGTTRLPAAPVVEPPTTRLPAPADETTRLKVPTDAGRDAAGASAPTSAPRATAAPTPTSTSASAPTTRTPRIDPNRPAGPARGPGPVRGNGGNGNREIESWLGDLRGNAPGPAAQKPSDATRPPGDRRPPPPAPPAAEPPTTAIPAQRPPDADSTEKIDTRDINKLTEELNSDDNPTRRGGGGVSAADLLRREGRL